MRAGARLSAGFLLLGFLLFSDSAFAAEAPRLTADVSSLAFGQLDPVSAAGVLPARINLFVSSAVAAQISIGTAREASADGRLPPARFAWRIPGDRFRELTPMLPAPIASLPGSAEPTQVTFEVEPVVGWDTPPGRYGTRLQLFINGSVATQFVRMVFSVLPRVDLTVGRQPFDSPGISPVQAKSYPYLQRMALVRSNVPWRLVAWTDGRPVRDGSGRALAASELRIAAPPAPAVVLAPGIRTVVTRGDPAATPRNVAIAVSLDVGAGELAGRYLTRLHFSAEPDAQSGR